MPCSANGTSPPTWQSPARARSLFPSRISGMWPRDTYRPLRCRGRQIAVDRLLRVSFNRFDLTGKTVKRLLAAVAVLAAAAVAHAALPTFWQVSTEAEFLQGDVENLSIDSYGRLSLGPATDTVYESSAPFLWTMISAPDGAVFVGSGNEGQIHRIDANGRGTLFFDAEELEVHAMVGAPGGGIYAATSRDGKICRVDGAGKGAVFFDRTSKVIGTVQ